MSNCDNIKDVVNKIVKIIDFHKGNKIAVVDLEHQTVIADYFIIAQGESLQQVKSLCDYVDEDLKKIDLQHNGIDGYNEGKWIVMDYGDIIVHLFRKEERDYYNLERLWETGRNITYI